MNRTTVARLFTALVLAAAFGLAGWQLFETAPKGQRDRPTAPIPLVDVIPSRPDRYPVRLSADGTLVSAEELEIRPEVGGRLLALHPDFEAGGRVPAGAELLRIDDTEYRLAVGAAQAEIAKAEAAIALERGRGVVAREELDILRGSVEIDAASESLALRAPQLRQVRAELSAAQNRLQRAELDLARTRLSLPFDVIVLERTRAENEVVAARELIGRVARADTLWLELSVQPDALRFIRSADRDGKGSAVRLPETGHTGRVIRIRHDLAAGSRMAGVIAEIPRREGDAAPLLLGSYVRAEIDGGELDAVITVPRRALRDNGRVWVVDSDDQLQVRRAQLAWASGQQLLLRDHGSADGLQPGDRIVVSRIDGLVPGTRVRHRSVDLETGRPLATAPAANTDD
jgi:RND family efflux transporter MFP subunit